MQALLTFKATTMRLLVSHQLTIEDYMRAGGLSHYPIILKSLLQMHRLTNNVATNTHKPSYFLPLLSSFNILEYLLVL